MNKLNGHIIIPCLFLNINYTRFEIMIYGDNLILSAKIYNENFFTSSNLLYDQLVFL